jgi:mRNA interferase RelE/StbE
MAYRVEFSTAAIEALEDISDRHTRAIILRRIGILTQEPNMQGKALRNELAGFRSVRAAGQRYRVIYRVNERDQQVEVHLVGIRKEGSRQDIYVLAQRLLERGFL